MRDKPEGGELDPEDDVYKCCKKNSPFSVLSCIDKKIREGCNQWCGNYFWTGGWQNQERQIDRIFIELGPRFSSRNRRSLNKKRYSPDFDRVFVPEISVL